MAQEPSIQGPKLVTIIKPPIVYISFDTQTLIELPLFKNVGPTTT